MDLSESSRGNGSASRNELASHRNPFLGRVLVLEDLPRPEGEDAVNDVQRSLLDQGFEVLGLESPNDGPLDDEELDVIAGARRAVELGDPTDTEAVRRLYYFLVGRTDLDAIIWLDDVGERDSALCQLLLRSKLPTDPPRRISLDGRRSSSRLGGTHDHRGDRR